MSISKNAQTVKYFAQRYRAEAHKGIPRKLLVKVIYLADVMAREYLGEPITNFEYKRDSWGPYDRAIKDAVAELEGAEMARQKKEWDDQKEHQTKRLVDLGIPITFDHSPGQMEIMRYVADRYLFMPMKELLADVVYRTTPMLEEQRYGARLPVELVNNRGKETVGFDLEEVLAAEQEIAAGKGAPDF